MAAAMLASKRFHAARLFDKLLSAPRLRPAAAAGARSFNNHSAQMRDTDDDERSLDVDRRGPREPGVGRRRPGEFFPSFFSDVFDPFNPTRSLSQVLNLMDQLADAPSSFVPRGAVGGVRRGWDAREGDDGLYLRIDMPGLGKEDVKVTVEQNTLVIKGEDPEKEFASATRDEEGGAGAAAASTASGRRYTSRIDLPAELYRLGGIKAEMKNGVLKVFVPKVKEEERKDVVQVQIE